MTPAIDQCDSTTVHPSMGKVRCVLEPNHADELHRCAFKTWPFSASHAATNECGCATNAGGLHAKSCPIWVNIGPNLPQRKYARRGSPAALTTTTPAGELRTAAAKIYALARKATPGPWKANDPDYPETIYGDDDNSHVIAGGRWGGEANVFDNDDDAYHMALWHPGIAFAIADWLDTEAYALDSSLSAYPEIDPERIVRWPLRIARAINTTEVA